MLDSNPILNQKQYVCYSKPSVSQAFESGFEALNYGLTLMQTSLLQYLAGAAYEEQQICCW